MNKNEKITKDMTTGEALSKNEKNFLCVPFVGTHSGLYFFYKEVQNAKNSSRNKH